MVQRSCGLRIWWLVAIAPEKAISAAANGLLTLFSHGKSVSYVLFGFGVCKPEKNRFAEECRKEKLEILHHPGCGIECLHFYNHANFSAELPALSIFVSYVSSAPFSASYFASPAELFKRPMNFWMIRALLSRVLSCYTKRRLKKQLPTNVYKWQPLCNNKEEDESIHFLFWINWWQRCGIELEIIIFVNLSLSKLRDQVNKSMKLRVWLLCAGQTSSPNFRETSRRWRVRRRKRRGRDQGLFVDRSDAVFVVSICCSLIPVFFPAMRSNSDV